MGEGKIQYRALVRVFGSVVCSWGVGECPVVRIRRMAWYFAVDLSATVGWVQKLFSVVRSLWTLLRMLWAFFLHIQAPMAALLQPAGVLQILSTKSSMGVLPLAFHIRVLPLGFHINGLLTFPPARGVSLGVCVPMAVGRLGSRAYASRTCKRDWVLGISGFSMPEVAFEVGGKRWSRIRCAQRVHGYCIFFRSSRSIELPCNHLWSGFLSA